MYESFEIMNLINTRLKYAIFRDFCEEIIKFSTSSHKL